MRRGSLAVLGLVLFVAACATGGSSGDTTPRRFRNVIAADELAELAGSYSAYDAVQRLRAGWLSGRGGTPPRVLYDGIEVGNVDVLRNYRLEDIREFRFVAPSDATTRYGTGYGGGAIEVFSK